jgi:hypothetical protein
MYGCAPLCCLNGWILLIRRCPVNTNIPAPKLEALEIGPKTQNCDFFFIENGCIDFDEISGT